ncbi:DsrE family protein [Candidatus Halobonum tyrrellensis]|uniref:DsrE family protein n=1 Tax=Candidatus Halobonum tyrrellensis TaxID=1431545 RepID=UPI0006782667|nr:DsrE family protein [Candidatus Halobonum tyrrellensis]
MQTVFHMIEGDEESMDRTLTLAGNLADDDTVDVDSIVVLAQAEGIDPLTKGGHGESEVQSLVEEGVSFAACSNTMEMMDLEESDLHDGVEVVSSGVGELTRLQNEGYAYIRP